MQTRQKKSNAIIEANKAPALLVVVLYILEKTIVASSYLQYSIAEAIL